MFEKWLRASSRQALGFALALLALAFLGWQGNAAAWPLFFLTLLLGVVAAGADVLSGLVAPFVKKRNGKPLQFIGVSLSVWASGLFVAFGLLYLLAPNPAFALAAFAGLAYLVLNELVPQVWTPAGIRASLSELAWALGVAAGAWVLFSAALGTRSPLDVVTSCSMTPALQRGDLIVLYGHDVQPRVSVRTDKTFAQFVDSLQVQTGLCTQTFSDGRSRPVTCQKTLLLPDGRNVTLAPGGQGDVVVYEPSPAVAGADLIIHRAVLGITASDGTFYLTKGDNNPVVDQSAGIGGAKADHVHGKMLLRVPVLGYLKLLLFLQFDNPANCQYQLQPNAS